MTANKSLNDRECEDLMLLYRLCKAGNATPIEAKKLKELLRRFQTNQKKIRPATKIVKGKVKK